MKLHRILVLAATMALAVLLFWPADLQAAPLGGLEDTCLETELKGCTIVSSGYLGLELGQVLAFQTQAGFTDEDGIKGGIVLFEPMPDGWRLLAKAFDGYRYDLPRLVEHDQTMLHIAGVTAGSGAYNADLLFLWTDIALPRGSHWQPIDLDHWFETVGPFLPEGLEIWQGIDYDFDDWFYDALDARTPLWRSDDGNCCPTGGWATIHFAIEDNALVVTGVDHLPPAKSK